MEKKLVFQILGIPETKDENVIRESYLTLLKDTNPEDDPEGFKRLREAYEEAVRLSKVQEEGEEEEPQGEVDLWMKRVAETYRDIFLRREADNWKELFDDPVCVSFDTFLEARGKLLAYISYHPFLPQTVWKLLDQVFHVLEDYESLKEEFHVNFLNHIEYHVNTEDFLDYGMFEETEAGYTPKDEDDTDNYIREYFKIKDKIESDDTEGVYQALTDLKRFGLYHPYEDVERLRLFIREETYEEGKTLAEEMLARYPDEVYVRTWAGKIFYDTGNEKRGYELWQAVLKEYPDYDMPKYFSIHYLMDQEEWYPARKYVIELLRANRGDEELLSLRNKIDEKLVPELRAALEAGRDYEDLSGDKLVICLGWCLLNLERYEETFALVEDKEISGDSKESFYELQAWSLFRLQRYEEAIPLYRKYLEMVMSGEHEEDEKTVRENKAAQARWCLADCLYKLDRREEGEQETRAAIDMAQDLRGRLDIQRYLADKYLSFKQYEKATEVCDEILAESEGYYPAYLIRQEACYHMRRAQQVVDDYYKAIELYAGYAGPYVFAAKIFYDYDQYQDAWGVIERARENQVEFSARLRFEEAKILRMTSQNNEERKKPQEILEALLGEALEGQGDIKDSSEIVFEQGLLLWDSDDAKQAADTFKKAIEMNPEARRYHLVLGNLYRDTKQYKEALEQYRMVEDVYHHTEFYFGMGVCHQVQKEWTEAIGYYEKAVEKEEYYRDTNRRLYQCYEERYSIEYRRSDYEKALYHINKEMEKKEDGYRLWDRAYLYNTATETELALADYRKALSLVDEEDRYIILENIGYTYKKNREFEKAYESFKEAVEAMEKEDTSAKGYIGMAECSFKQRNYERTIFCCREGLRIFPGNDNLWGYLSDSYEETDRFEEALQVEEDRRKHGGKDIDYYNHVSFLMLKMDKVKECIDIYGKCKEEMLERSADKKELAQFYENVANRYEELIENQKAVEMFHNALALQDDYWDRFDSECYLVKNYCILGEWEKAKHHAERAMECIEKRNTTPEDYMTWPGYMPIRTGWMGWIYLGLGEKEKAKKCFEDMETLPPCGSCKYHKCFEASLWLGYYYFCEKEYDKTEQLMEETLTRDFDALAAKYMLEKLRAGMKEN